MTYNFCQKCCTRFEACETCHAVELAAKDKEIARLKKVLDCFNKRNSWLEIHLSMGDRNEYEKLIRQGRLG